MPSAEWAVSTNALVTAPPATASHLTRGNSPPSVPLCPSPPIRLLPGGPLPPVPPPPELHTGRPKVSPQASVSGLSQAAALPPDPGVLCPSPPSAVGHLAAFRLLPAQLLQSACCLGALGPLPLGCRQVWTALNCSLADVPVPVAYRRKSKLSGLRLQPPVEK
ncbi:formin-like protein 5 [Sciurus carolinensis]|uniref:formin-like protein 5 n=1 Tax=Sciurus carolinensis TaxID=30640 RepID=UPI001FB3474D|nr:formin-like protein 5 [Sciurus carolinensis]